MRLPSDRRAGWLGEACAGDAALLEEARRLVDNAEPGGLSAIIRDAAEAAVGALGGEPLYEHIGPYRIEGLLRRGGMGEVYAAERDDGRFRQRVAIKVMARAGDSALLATRFRAERQILANLDHPHIARLLDGGETEDGRPYLVMEYVDGERIDDYCNRHGLSLSERLGLFRKVCLAVQHAHANLVIHRDIKPSNILVTRAGEPKLLDFGIAKLLDPVSYGPAAPETRDAMRLMTPEYASPEQVLGGTITTATDVYALGVLLYELLARARPYRFEDAGPAAIVAAICETEPLRPSVAATRTRDPETGKARQADAEALQRRLRGDLDNIVLLAMRKEPEARYTSPSELAEDVRRYLSGLPVNASRGNWLYYTRKFLLRHGGKAATAATMLVLAVGATAWYTAELARQRDAAEQERRTAEEVTDFLIDIFRDADPNRADVLSVTVQEVLDRGAARIDAELTGAPLIRARLKRAIGRVYLSLGVNDTALELQHEAVRLNETAPGASALELAASLEDLAYAQWRKELLEESLATARRALGIRERELGPGHPSLARPLDALGTTAFYLDRWEESADYYRRALDLSEGDAEQAEARLITMSNLTITLETLGRYAEAERLHRESLALRESHFGSDHPRTAHSLANFGTFLLNRRRPDEAAPLLERALAIQQRAKGPDHADVGFVLGDLAVLERERGNYPQAERYAVQAADTMRAALGPGHSRYGAALDRLASIQRRAGKLEAALASATLALEVLIGANGPDHSWVADPHFTLGRIHADLGDLAAARRHLARAADIRTRTGAPPESIVAARSALGRILLQTGEYGEAEAVLGAAWSLGSQRQDVVPAAALAEVLRFRAEALEALGRAAQAEEARRQAASLTGPAGG